MFLELLDIENFIKTNNLLEVKNGKYPSSKGFEEDGLWSETIFGKTGSKNRKQQFGYINLKQNFIHPTVFRLLKSISDPTSKLIREKGKYEVKDKKLIENKISGETGINFLIREFNNIDFASFCHADKLKEAEFIQENKNKILINKFLVLPAGDRDINLNDLRSISKTSEINEVYRSLLFQINSLSGISELDNLLTKNIQDQLVKLSDFIKDTYLKGKKGLIRNSMLKKTLDFSSRIILTSSPDIPLGKIGIPWHTALNIFEPLVTYNLYKTENNEILDQLKSFTKKEDFDFHDLIKFLNELVKNPNNLPEKLKSNLIELITEITKTQQVICKRDPVLQRNSWFAADIIICDGRVAVVNSLDLGPIGGDCDGDAVAIIPVFTEEAKNEIREKMNPSYAKSKWKNTVSMDSILYTPSLDAVATIFKATKDYD